MRGAEGVVLALGAAGVAGDTALRTQRLEPLVAPGEQLVRVALVADVPDQLVAGRVEDAVQREGQLDHAEVRRQVAAAARATVWMMTWRISAASAAVRRAGAA